ncbi:MAG: MFS transporter [Bacillota bacterium]
MRLASGDPSRRRFIVLAGIFIATFVTAYSDTSIKILLPYMMDDLQVKVNAILMPISGRVGDMYGPKKFILSGLVIMATGSILCGIAPNFTYLVGARAVQAIGAALIYPNAVSLMMDVVPQERRGVMLGVWGSIGAIGGITGPVMAGYLVQLFSWRVVFFSTIPMGILAFGFLAYGIENKIKTRDKSGFDYLGGISLTLTTLSILLGITSGPDLGWNSPIVRALFVIGIGSAVAFFHVEKRVPRPLVDLSLFKNRTFSLGLACGFITTFAVSGTLFIMPIFLRMVQGYKSSQVALLLVPTALTVSLISPLGGRISDRLGYSIPIGVGMLIRAVSFGLLALLGFSTGYMFIGGSLILNGLALGLTNSPILNAALSSASTTDYGVAAGLTSMAQLIGNALGTTITGIILYSLLPASNMFKSISGPTPGFHQVFLFLAAICLLGSCLGWFTGGKKIRKEQTTIVLTEKVENAST